MINIVYIWLFTAVMAIACRRLKRVRLLFATLSSVAFCFMLCPIIPQATLEKFGVTVENTDTVEAPYGTLVFESSTGVVTESTFVPNDNTTVEELQSWVSRQNHTIFCYIRNGENIMYSLRVGKTPEASRLSEICNQYFSSGLLPRSTTVYRLWIFFVEC